MRKVNEITGELRVNCNREDVERLTGEDWVKVEKSSILKGKNNMNMKITIVGISVIWLIVGIICASIYYKEETNILQTEINALKVARIMRPNMAGCFCIGDSTVMHKDTMIIYRLLRYK